MKKLIIAIFTFISINCYSQVQDITATGPVPATGPYKNNKTVHYANAAFDYNLRIPRYVSWSLIGAKDSIGYVMYNTTLNKYGCYFGNGVWKAIIFSNDNVSSLVNDAGYLKIELEPLFKASSAYTITDALKNNWNTAYSWGDHHGLYLPANYVPYWDNILGKPTFATVSFSGDYNDLLNRPGSATTIKGDKGDTGATGPQGPIGLTGAKGDQGIQGIPGIKGDQGLTGNNGVDGQIGATGAKGDVGSQGPIGLTGQTGATGSQGLKGDQGIQGIQGAAGTNGMDGATNATLQSVTNNGNTTTQPITAVSFHAVTGSPLNYNSFGSSAYESRVSAGDYGNSARPGYGFHAVNNYGVYLYANGAAELRFNNTSSGDYHIWSDYDFNQGDINNWRNVNSGVLLNNIANSVTGQANSATIYATSANTPNTIVLRDPNGSFAFNDALLGTKSATLSSLFDSKQPLENQRLSTTNTVNFGQVFTSNNRVVDNGSYANSGFMNSVPGAGYNNGARPGYGFLAEGIYGLYLYSNNGVELRFNNNSGQDYHLWSSVDFGQNDITNWRTLNSGSTINNIIPESQVTNLVTHLNAKEPTIATGSAGQIWQFNKTWITLNTSIVPENVNLYFTNSRARLALSSSSPFGAANTTAAGSYNSSTGVITFNPIPVSYIDGYNVEQVQNGTNTTVIIAHGISGANTSSVFVVVPTNQLAATNYQYATWDATNITLHYSTTVGGTYDYSFMVKK